MTGTAGQCGTTLATCFKTQTIEGETVLSVRGSGSGPAIVLVCGARARPAAQWDHLLVHCARHGQAMFVLNPLETSRWTSFEDALARFGRVMAALQVPDVLIASHSYGALIAAAYPTRIPDPRVRGHAWIAPPLPPLPVAGRIGFSTNHPILSWPLQARTARSWRARNLGPYTAAEVLREAHVARALLREAPWWFSPETLPRGQFVLLAKDPRFPARRDHSNRLRAAGHQVAVVGAEHGLNARAQHDIAAVLRGCVSRPSH